MPGPAAEPPIAPGKGDMPINPEHANAAPGITKSPLFSALDSHFDKKPPVTPNPSDPTKGAKAPSTPEPPKDKSQPSDKQGADDPLSSLVSEPEPPEPAKADKGAEPDFAEFDKQFPDDADHTKNNPKANEAWKAIKKTAKEAKREAAALKTEREALQKEIAEIKKGTPASAPEVEDLRKRVADYEQRDAVFKLESDPEFRGKVLAPLGDAYNAIDALIKTYKIDPSKLNEALAKPERTERNQALSKIIADADMNPLDQGDFTKTIGAVQDLEMKRMEAYQKAQELTAAAQDTLKQQEVAKQQKRDESIEAADRDVFEKLSTKVDVIKDILSDDKTALDIRKRADLWLKSAEKTPEMEVYHAYAGFLLKPMQQKIKELTAELAKYKARVTEEVQGEAPAGGGGQRVQQTPPPEKLKPGEGVGRAVEEWAAGRR